MTRVLVDVSRLLEVGTTSGVQRVARELSSRLVGASDDELDVVLVGWDRTDLHFDVFDEASALACLAGADGMPDVVGTRTIEEFEDGEVFLDLDAVWTSTLKRSTLYPVLRASGVRVVTFVHDMVPLEVPRSVGLGPTANWAVWISAVMAYADLVLTNSRDTERAFLSWKERFGVSRDIPTLVTRLGADLPERDAPTEKELRGVAPFLTSPYVLFVGTLEPRKRQLLALEAFDLLRAERPDVHLVFAGRSWKLADEITETITGHPAYGTRVHWVDGPSDALLNELYRRATLATYFSRLEGFGLPIAESLGHGKVTLASRNSAMYEVGREAADYTYADTPREIADTLAAYLRDPELLATRERHVREAFTIVGWDTVARTIERALRGLGSGEPQVVHVRDDLIRRPGPVSRSAGVDALDRDGFELLGYDDPPPLDPAWQADAEAWAAAQEDVSGLDPAVLALNHAVTRHPTAFRKVFAADAEPDLHARTLPLRSREGLAHGMLRFGDVHVSGLPTVVAIEAGGTATIEVSVQGTGSLALGVDGFGSLAVDGSPSYAVGLEHLVLSGTTPGVTRTSYVAGGASYPVTVVVVGPGAGVEAVEAALTPPKRGLLSRLRRS